MTTLYKRLKRMPVAELVSLDIPYLTAKAIKDGTITWQQLLCCDALCPEHLCSKLFGISIIADYAPPACPRCKTQFLLSSWQREDEKAYMSHKIGLTQLVNK